MASNTYDAIVIGGGHNGLTSGAYFAREGARTVVLEGRHKTGGAADTSAPFADHPEINVTTYSYVMSLMPPSIIRELNLKRHGYDVTPFGPYFQAFPDGRAITVYADDAAKSYDSIAQFSKKDADTLPKWEAWMKGVSDVLGPLLLSVPPHVGSTKLGDLLPQAQTAWSMRKLGERGVADVTRLFTMSVSDLLNDWFESDAIKAMLTVNGVIGTWAGPDEPGTAYVMLHHSIGDVGDGHLGSWGFQQGGMGAVMFSPGEPPPGRDSRTDCPPPQPGVATVPRLPQYRRRRCGFPPSPENWRRSACVLQSHGQIRTPTPYAPTACLPPPIAAAPRLSGFPGGSGLRISAVAFYFGIQGSQMRCDLQIERNNIGCFCDIRALGLRSGQSGEDPAARQARSLRTSRCRVSTSAKNPAREIVREIQRPDAWRAPW